MKILYIDPFCNPGHINFNYIHIKNLVSEGYKLDCIFAPNYNDKLPINTNVIYKIDIEKYDGRFKGIFNRINLIKNLIKIKQNINLKGYDAIIFSHYDEISILIANFSKSFLINHTNISDISRSFFKRLVFKYISKKHTQLLLDESSFRYMKELKIENAFLLRHGMIDKFDIKPETIENIVGKDLPHNSKIVFSPSNGSFDKDFLLILFENKKFQSFLKDNNIYFILKNYPFEIHEDNIINIGKRLTEKEYQSLFILANVIFLPYPKSFKYRASGVFFEVLANNKQCMVSTAPTFEEYIPIIGKNSIYYDIDDLQNKIIKHLNNNDIIDYSSALKNLKPDYSFLNGRI